MGGLRFVACRSALSSLSLSSCARIQLLNAQLSQFITQICAFTEGRFPAMVSRFACSSFSEEHEEVERSSEREVEKRFARAAWRVFLVPITFFILLPKFLTSSALQKNVLVRSRQASLLSSFRRSPWTTYAVFLRNT